MSRRRWTEPQTGTNIRLATWTGSRSFYQEMLQISGQMNSMMLPMIDSIDVSRTGSRTVYT